MYWDLYLFTSPGDFLRSCNHSSDVISGVLIHDPTYFLSVWLRCLDKTTRNGKNEILMRLHGWTNQSSTSSHAPATFSDRATMPVTSLPGCWYTTRRIFLPSGSVVYKQEISFKKLTHSITPFLTFTTLSANSAGDELMILLWLFPWKKVFDVSCK